MPLRSVELRNLSGVWRMGSRQLSRFSHFGELPIPLLAVAYDKGWVNTTFGPSLWIHRRDRKFMNGSPELLDDDTSRQNLGVLSPLAD
jgi:hypothetical protein